MKKSYVVPEAEIVEVTVEQGFAGSYGGVDSNPNDVGETPVFPGEDTDW